MKYIVSIVLLLFVCNVNAQLTLTNLADNSAIVDGDSFTINTTVFEDAKLKFRISNSSTTETINVLGQLVSYSNTDGTGTQFCVNPQCFFDMQPGATVPGQVNQPNSQIVETVTYNHRPRNM